MKAGSSLFHALVAACRALIHLPWFRRPAAVEKVTRPRSDFGQKMNREVSKSTKIAYVVVLLGDLCSKLLPSLKQTSRASTLAGEISGTLTFQTKKTSREWKKWSHLSPKKKTYLEQNKKNVNCHLSRKPSLFFFYPQLCFAEQNAWKEWTKNLIPKFQMVVKNDEFHGTIRKITKKTKSKQWTFPWLRSSASALKGSTSAQVHPEVNCSIGSSFPIWNGKSSFFQ